MARPIAKPKPEPAPKFDGKAAVKALYLTPDETPASARKAYAAAIDRAVAAKIKARGQ